MKPDFFAIYGIPGIFLKSDKRFYIISDRLE